MNPINLILKSKEKKIKVDGLLSTSKWFFIENIISFETNKTILVITEQINLETTTSDMSFFIKKFSEKENYTICTYPAWEILPFEPLSPHPDITGERLNVLYKLLKGERLIIVTTIEAITQKVMPCDILKDTSLKFEKGDLLERDLITDYLISGGYQFKEMVECKGEFNVRGDIIDIFPTSSNKPIRIEFFGDEIEKIKEFDINSQRSMKIIDNITILPAIEIVRKEDLCIDALEKLKKYSQSIGKNSEAILECFSQFIHFSGMERFAPFFYNLVPFFNYLPQDAYLIVDESEIISKSETDFNKIIDDEYQISIKRDDVYITPDMFYLSRNEIKSHLDRYKQFELSSLKLSTRNTSSFTIEIKTVNIFQHFFNTFQENLKKWLIDGYSIFIVVETDGQAQRFKELLIEKEIGVNILSKGDFLNKKTDNTAYITIGKLSSGFQLKSSKIIFVTENEIYGDKKKIKIRKGVRKDKLLAEVDQIKPGGFVVHIDYGIGRYLGTKFITISSIEEEFFNIEYADGQKLYLPMEKISYLQKYRGVDEVEPQLAKLGSISWNKAKTKARKAVLEVAQDLLKLYANREKSAGFSFSSESSWHKEFADSFEYNETEDQLRTIEDIMEDMEQTKPMDRLVCGDVGFGKTEVAMRATFKAVFDEKQICLLVPTTLLAYQHYQSFLERFRSFPVKIEMLSRFKSTKEQHEIIKDVSAGKVDIIIGTHRLLQKDIKFKNLGLIIIDEEHRFGVSHKEKLKKLKTSVDTLALTATPIPRTLHLSLAGIRDMSIIATPPHNRQAIRTYVRKFSDNVIHEAVLRELERGGQIYFLHNRVENIEAMAEYINKLIPHAKIGVAHGQMQKNRLENMMIDFIGRKFDILLCTTIIESGIDIPSANTIIINRADRFGLAQLHQLRGRVGRDKHRAYAYLLVPDEALTSKSARARLEAMEELSDLGAGLMLATRDLEIRGSGNILGHKQSGHVSSIGFYMYCNLLEETIKELKGEPVEKLIDISIKIGIKGYIPKTFIPDVNQRLEMYKRIYMVEDIDRLEDITDELIDRFGRFPKALNDLIFTLRLRILAGILKIETILLEKDNSLSLTFDPDTTPLEYEKIFTYMKKRKYIRFKSEHVLNIFIKEEDPDKKYEIIERRIKELLKLQKD